MVSKTGGVEIVYFARLESQTWTLIPSTVRLGGYAAKKTMEARHSKTYRIKPSLTGNLESLNLLRRS